MSTTADEYRQYAEENLMWARRSRTEKEKAMYYDLARDWMHKAVVQDEIETKETRRPKPGNLAK